MSIEHQNSPRETVKEALKVLCHLFSKRYSEELALIWSHYINDLTDEQIKKTTDHWATCQNSFPTIKDFKHHAKIDEKFIKRSDHSISNEKSTKKISKAPSIYRQLIKKYKKKS